MRAAPFRANQKTATVLLSSPINAVFSTALKRRNKNSAAKKQVFRVVNNHHWGCWSAARPIPVKSWYVSTERYPLVLFSQPDLIPYRGQSHIISTTIYC
jgi:hypothetical protein